MLYQSVVRWLIDVHYPGVRASFQEVTSTEPLEDETIPILLLFLRVFH